jgi:hypothetical protein
MLLTDRFRGIVGRNDGKPLPQFEPLNGVAPFRALDQHPDNVHVALQTPNDESAVWDINTGNIVWRPDETPALCWMSGGGQFVALRSHYTPAPDGRGPAQRDYTHYFERRWWSGKEIISSCDIGIPTGWLVDVVASPSGDVAAFAWREQDCAGFELVSIGPEGDHQLDNAGYRTQQNLTEAPTFSPNGRYLVFTCGRKAWWSEGDPEKPSAGGKFECGHIAILDLGSGIVREEPLVESASPGWLPTDRDAIYFEMVGMPTFVSDTHFTVISPLGRMITLSCQG